MSTRDGKHTGNATDTVNDIVDQFLANGVVATGIVVGGVFLSTDKVFRVEELAMATSADFIDGLYD